MAPVVLALGFDLFFRPKLQAAAKEAGVELRTASPQEAAKACEGVDRVVADVSAPGVDQALVALRKTRPDLPILACYPHVEERLAEGVRALGGRAVTRGAFNQRLADALSGTL